MIMNRNSKFIFLAMVHLFGHCLAIDYSYDPAITKILDDSKDLLNKIRSAVFKKDFDEKVRKAADELIMERGIAQAFKSKASEEYEKRIQLVIDNLDQFMLNRKETYVSLFDIEQTVKEKFKGFVNKPIEIPEKTQKNQSWWSFFFD